MYVRMHTQGMRVPQKAILRFVYFLAVLLMMGVSLFMHQHTVNCAHVVVGVCVPIGEVPEVPEVPTALQEEQQC